MGITCSEPKLAAAIFYFDTLRATHAPPPCQGLHVCRPVVGHSHWMNYSTDLVYACSHSNRAIPLLFGFLVYIARQDALYRSCVFWDTLTAHTMLLFGRCWSLGWDSRTVQGTSQRVRVWWIIMHEPSKLSQYGHFVNESWHESWTKK